VEEVRCTEQRRTLNLLLFVRSVQERHKSQILRTCRFVLQGGTLWQARCLPPQHSARGP
jgi:hypothetical protein